MKNKLTLFLLGLIVVTTVNIALAQETKPQVRVSVSLTNHVFKIGSSTTLTATTKNLSTNDIRIQTSFPTVFYDVQLMDDRGKSYRVVTPMSIRGMRLFATLKPGEERVDQVPLTFGKEIEPGNYVLKATRSFTIEAKEFKVTSNDLKMQIDR